MHTTMKKYADLTVKTVFCAEQTDITAGFIQMKTVVRDPAKAEPGPTKTVTAIPVITAMDVNNPAIHFCVSV